MVFNSLMAAAAPIHDRTTTLSLTRWPMRWFLLAGGRKRDTTIPGPPMRNSIGLQKPLDYVSTHTAFAAR